MIGKLLFVILLVSGPTSAMSIALNSQGQWIVEADGQAMENPQPSGLVAIDDELWFVSDRSADKRQRQRMHRLDPKSGALLYPALPIRVDDDLRDNCFYDYVTQNPDYEAMVLDTSQGNSMLLVTEDMTYYPVSAECLRKWSPTGSAPVPFLLLKARIDDNELLIEAIKPIQFDETYQIGRHPNDGIEGLAIDSKHTLYLALEKDANNNPRIFSVPLDNVDWQTDEFVTLDEPPLKFPQPGDGRHPLNALQYIPAQQSPHPGFLAAFARNLNQLWLIDLAGKAEARVIPVSFWAPTDSEQCAPYELMDNASIEGLAIQGDSLYLVNDPWKINYSKNINCESNRAAYSRYAPLLFKIKFSHDWLATTSN